MAGILAKPLKSTLSLVKDTLVLPLENKAVSIPFSAFSNLKDLTHYLSSHGALNITFTSLEGAVFSPDMSLEEIKFDPFLISLNDEVFKIMPGHAICNFSALELYDSLNFSGKERQLLQHHLKFFNNLYKDKSFYKKGELKHYLIDCITDGNSDYIKNKERFKELSGIYAEKIDEYLEIKKIGEIYANRMLWGGYLVVTFQWLYIGIGTYMFFSWDLMEPQAYVINLGNAILIYAAYALKKQEFTRERIFHLFTEKKMEKVSSLRGFDLKGFNEISKELSELKSKI